MEADQAEQFIKALGSKQVKQRQGWVVGTCPLAHWTHKGGKDSNPSFGITIKPGEHSNFNCYACTSGSAEELLQTLEMYWQTSGGDGGKPDFKLARELLDEELKVMPLPGYKEFGAAKVKPFEEWPLYYIDSFLPASSSSEAMNYLHSRMVTDEEIERYNLRWDTHRRMVVFPYHNVYGKLAGARGRCIDAGVASWKKHFDYTWNNVNNSALVWYNEPALQLPGPVVVVEGQFDVLRVAKVWPKVVGNLTGKPVSTKLNRLLQSSEVIQIPDNDGPGGTGDNTVPLYQDYCLTQGIPYRCLTLPLPEGDSKIDPGECHPEFLRELLLPYALSI